MYVDLLADMAATCGIPASFFLNMYPTWVPPPFPLIPVGVTSNLPHAPLSETLPWATKMMDEWSRYCADWLSPLLLTTSLHIHGLRLYGYPRHLFSSIYSRPFLAVPGYSAVTVPLPRSVIILGPQVSTQPPSTWNFSSVNPLNLSAALPCITQRPLLVSRPHRLIYIAFGTLVKLPKQITSMFCTASRSLLDAREVDVIVFARRPLDFNDTDALETTCMDTVAPECDDVRIWSTAYAQQETLLMSGRYRFIFFCPLYFSFILPASDL